MSDNENKTLVDRFWAAFESGDFDTVTALLDADVHWKMPGVETRGSKPLLEMLRAYRVGFPDLRHETRSHVESGDAIAVELFVTGTHRGPMQTPQGSAPATGRKLALESCDYIRVRQGKIASWHVYHDPTPFLTAIGLIG